MAIKRITVAQHERALVWKNKTFAGVLEPGKHWLIAPMSDVQAHLYDLTGPEFEHARVDFLIKEAGATMQKYFDIVELTDSEAGLVYKNGKLAGVLAPGKRQLYWKGPIEVKVEKVDIAADPEVAVPVAKVPVLARTLSLAPASAAAKSAPSMTSFPSIAPAKPRKCGSVTCASRNGPPPLRHPRAVPQVVPSALT